MSTSKKIDKNVDDKSINDGQASAFKRKILFIIGLVMAIWLILAGATFLYIYYSGNKRLEALRAERDEIRGYTDEEREQYLKEAKEKREKGFEQRLEKYKTKYNVK